MLKPDHWLAGCLNRPCYFLPPEAQVPTEASLPTEERAFVFAKVGCRDLERSHRLCDIGFRVVDTGLTLAKLPGSIDRGGDHIRPANPADESAVKSIAGNAYQYSRFHLDPLFHAHEASHVKEAWVANFFRGKRGDHLLIAEVDGAVAGFLLALQGTSEMIVDLIATHPSFQRRGIGVALISHLATLAPETTIVAGTQAANLDSVKFYEKQGFRLRNSHHILHWHK